MLTNPFRPIWCTRQKRLPLPSTNEIHAGFIRELVERQYDKTAAQKAIILYGGSMNAGNAKELLREENIDGGLVGGAFRIETAGFYFDYQGDIILRHLRVYSNGYVFHRYKNCFVNLNKI